MRVKLRMLQMAALVEFIVGAGLAIRTSRRGELVRHHRMLALVEHASHAVMLRENGIIQT